MKWVAASVGWVSFLEAAEAGVASVFQLVELSSYLEVGEEGVVALVFRQEVLVSYLGGVVVVEEGTFHSLEGEGGEAVAVDAGGRWVGWGAVREVGGAGVA